MPRPRSRPRPLPAVLAVPLLAAGLGGCAGSAAPPQRAAAPWATPVAAGPLVVAAPDARALPPTGPADAGDPWEGFNRRVLDLNLALDDAVLRPLALGYRAALPEWGRVRVRRFLENLDEPRVLANTLLQGRGYDSAATTMRFFLNSTAGVGGLFDVAGPAGLPRRSGDFGQTLAGWGVPDGPYLMLPVAGPSNPRDTAGMVADGFANPVNWLLPVGANLGRGAVSGLDLREQNVEGLDELRRGSLDFYARLRSVWRQRRDAELGRAADAGDRLDVLEDPGEGPARPVPAAR